MTMLGRKELGIWLRDLGSVAAASEQEEGTAVGDWQLAAGFPSKSRELQAGISATCRSIVLVRDLLSFPPDPLLLEAFLLAHAACQLYSSCLHYCNHVFETGEVKKQ